VEARVSDAYAGLARVYNVLLGDLEQWSEQWYARIGGYLEGIPRGARILDCACGTGAQAYALASNGHEVTAADASGEMLDEARALFNDRGLEVPTRRCRWTELPEAVGGDFDVVLCLGNSISHCPDTEAMTAALGAMRRVTKPGGRLLVDSRSWETLMESRPRFSVGSPRLFQGVRTLPVYVWSLADWGCRSTAEILFVFEHEPVPTFSSYTIEMFPFRRRKLEAVLTRCGFTDIVVWPFEQGDRYCVVCRAE